MTCTIGYLGKSILRPLLKVVVVDEVGNTDSMAWYVPDVGSLKRTLEEARHDLDPLFSARSGHVKGPRYLISRMAFTIRRRKLSTSAINAGFREGRT